MDSRVRELREQKEWTQAKLAKKAGVHVNTIQRIENGMIENTTLGTLIKVAIALGTNIEGLFFLENVCANASAKKRGKIRIW